VRFRTADTDPFRRSAKDHDCGYTGQLRDEATLEYAWMIADRDPERAASYLDQLPQTEGKQNLEGKIKHARQESGSPAR
jgi:hypothetical protein